MEISLKGVIKSRKRVEQKMRIITTNTRISSKNQNWTENFFQYLMYYRYEVLSFLDMSCFFNSFVVRKAKSPSHKKKNYGKKKRKTR